MIMAMNYASTVRPIKPQTADFSSAGGAGLRAFARIAEAWGLTVAEQLKWLGIASGSTFFKWRREPDPRLPKDTLERPSYFPRLQNCPQFPSPAPKTAAGWLPKPNT